MRFEESCTLPVSRKVAWDYLIDPKTWQFFWNGMVELVDADRVRWEQAGDELQFVYRLFGRHLEGSGELLELRPGEYVRFAVNVPAIGDVTEEWIYEEVDDDSMILRVTCETAEPTSIFGKVVDRTVLPAALRRDLLATLRNVEELFAYGPPDVV